MNTLVNDITSFVAHVVYAALGCDLNHGTQHTLEKVYKEVNGFSVMCVGDIIASSETCCKIVKNF